MNKVRMQFCVFVALLFLLFSVPAWASSVEGEFRTIAGELYYEKAGFRLEVPSNVFNQFVKIKVEDAASGSIVQKEDYFVAKALDVYMTNRNSQAVGYLSKPIRVVFFFDSLDHKRASRLNTNLAVSNFRIGYWDELEKIWIELPSQVYWNGSNGLVEAETDRGKGRYALLWTYKTNAHQSKMAEKGIRIMVNLSIVRPDVPPYLKNGRTMVPLRVVAENIGARVEWLSAEQRIDLIRGTDTVQLWIGKSEAIKNKQLLPLDVAPEVVGGRTFVPLRFVSEAFGAKVFWDAMTQTAKVQSN